MLTTLAVEGYRSLRRLVVPLARVTVVTGPNGSDDRGGRFALLLRPLDEPPALAVALKVRVAPRSQR